MRMKMALMAIALSAIGLATLTVGPQDDGVFHPDHSRVFNNFQDATSALVGDVSSVPPDSECKQTHESKWRCYRRWAPVGQPEAAEMLQADVDVYEQRVVVGTISRVPD
jgi:hypothetical protein